MHLTLKMHKKRKTAVYYYNLKNLPRKGKNMSLIC